jgi:hypothetical protein
VKDRTHRHLLQQQVAGRAIGDLAAGQKEGDWPAPAIGQGVYLGGAPAA